MRPTLGVPNLAFRNHIDFNQLYYRLAIFVVPLLRLFQVYYRKYSLLKNMVMQ